MRPRVASEVLVTNISHGIVDAQVSEVIRTKKHSALDLASLGQKFDLIYGINVLEHIPKPPELISAIQQALNPGGLRLLEWRAFMDFNERAPCLG